MTETDERRETELDAIMDQIGFVFQTLSLYVPIDAMPSIEGSIRAGLKLAHTRGHDAGMTYAENTLNDILNNGATDETKTNHDRTAEKRIP